MNECQDPSPQGALAPLARKLGRSRNGQVLVAGGIVAFWSLFAYLCLRDGDLAVRFLAFGLVCYGLRVAWGILPIPSETRA